MSVIARDLAVQVIDGIHGYTAEFAAPSPEWHREMYDRAEEIIARALNTQGAVGAEREWLKLILKADQASDTERALATLAQMAEARFRELRGQ